VRVDDVDPQGKVALSPVGDLPTQDGDNGGGGSSGGGGAAPEEPAGRGQPAPAVAPDAAVQVGGAAADREYVSFEDSFEGEARRTFGDLGPEAQAPSERGGEGGGPRRNTQRRRSGNRR
jgi:hypothetical protein